MSSKNQFSDIQNQVSVENIESQSIPIVFFGRLEERKGLCTFVKAIQGLTDELRKKIKVIFMGKVVPLYSSELKHLNSEEYLKRELEGVVNYEIISNFYSQQAIQYIRDLDSVIVCLTSPQENFPNTALEMGQLPVTLVVSDTGGFRETLQLVQRQDCLYWFQPQDEESLQLQLESAIESYPEYPQVAQKSTLENINRKLLEEKVNYIETAFQQAKPFEKTTAVVTIGIINHQQGEYLIDCLSSLEMQTYPHIEIIVIDDHSTDGNSQELFNHASSLYPNYQFISNSHRKGVGSIRNEILRKATGDYFLFLSPQVTFYPQTVEKFVETAVNNQADIVTSAQKEVGKEEKIVSYSGGTLPTMMQKNVYGGECCLFSRQILTRFSHTEDKTITTQNWEILTAAVVTGKKILSYPYPLYEYHIKENSTTIIDDRAKYSLRQYLGKIPPQEWTSRQIYMLLTAIQQLQDLPSQVYDLQFQLDRSQQKLNECQNLLRQLEENNTGEESGGEVIIYYDDDKVKQEIEKIEYSLYEAKERIAAMESSKFWQLREKWFKIKKNLGLPVDE
jgi:hypothetical protein